jgi:hypothetical protein
MNLSPRLKAILTGAALPLLVTGVLLWRSQPAPATPPLAPPSKVKALLIQKNVLSSASAALLESAAPPDKSIPYSGPEQELTALARLNELPAEEIRAACEKLKSLVGDSDFTAGSRLRALLLRWTSLAPAEAFAWAMEATAAHPPPDNWSHWQLMLNDCGNTWAAADAQGLVSWWGKTGSKLSPTSGVVGERDTIGELITVRIAEWLAGTNALEAARYFAAAPDIHRADSSGVTMNFGHGSVAKTLQSAEEAAAALDLLSASASTHEGWREPAKDILSAWIAFDVESLENHLPSLTDKIIREQAAEMLGRHRMKTAPDPATAADAWLANPNGLSPQRIQALIVDAWSLQALDAAGEWLNHRPRTPERWDAVEQFSRRALSVDPAAAFTWLGTIENETERHRRTARLFDRWERTDPVRATSFAQTSGWNPAQMQWIEELRAVR